MNFWAELIDGLSPLLLQYQNVRLRTQGGKRQFHNSVGIDCGSGGWAGCRRAKGVKLEQL